MGRFVQVLAEFALSECSCYTCWV